MNRYWVPTTWETRDDGEDPGITGLASVFYDGTSRTQYELWMGVVERIMPHAFDRAIREDSVVALFNHDPNWVLGHTRAKTLSLSIDPKGLRYKITPSETRAYQDLREYIAAGSISGSSFSFKVKSTDQTWRHEDGIDIREINSVQLFDVGPVTFPAYAGTTAGLRSEGDIEEALSAYNSFSLRSQTERIRAKFGRDVRSDWKMHRGVLTEIIGKLNY